MKKILFIIPIIIGLFLSIFFSHRDEFKYDPLFPNDAGLFERIAFNLKSDLAFSGSTGEEKVFCPVRPPLYPVILALLMKVFGEGWEVVLRILQILAYLSTIWIISRIAIELNNGNEFAAFIASVTAAFIPHTAALTHTILTESFTIFLLALSVLLTVKTKLRGSAISYMVTAVSYGLLILIRPTFLLLPPIILLYLIFPFRRPRIVLSRLAIFSLSLFLLLLPWILVNYSFGNKITPTRLAGVGFNMMTGIMWPKPNFDEEVHKFEMLQKDDTMESKEITVMAARDNIKGTWLNEKVAFNDQATQIIRTSVLLYLDAWKDQPPRVESVMAADTVLLKSAVLWIRTHPFAYLSVMTNNLNNMLFGEYQPLVYDQLSRHGLYLVNLGRIVLYILCLLGIVAAILSGRFHSIYLPMVIISYHLFIYMPMHTEPRYLVEAYPFMALTIPCIIGISKSKKSN